MDNLAFISCCCPAKTSMYRGITHAMCDDRFQPGAPCSGLPGPPVKVRGQYPSVHQHICTEEASHHLAANEICENTLDSRKSKNSWLVVDLPLWKIWVSWHDEIPNIWKNKNVPNHRPDSNSRRSIDKQWSPGCYINCINCISPYDHQSNSWEMVAYHPIHLATVLSPLLSHNICRSQFGGSEFS